MRGRPALAAAASAVLTVTLSLGTGAQSSDADIEDIRYTSDYFEVTFPATWTVQDTADLNDRQPAGYGLTGVKPDTGATCNVWAHVDTPGVARPPATSSTFTDEAAVDLPSGPGWVQTEKVADGVTEQRAWVMYIVDLGAVEARVACWDDEPDDDWIEVAGSLRSRVPEDGLELGWPDVPITEQQTWERLSPVSGIARRQLIRLAQTQASDLRWYLECKDRLHDVVPVGSIYGPWDEHFVLRAIEEGSACWATRNRDSDAWDYSDWTTPDEALGLRLKQQLDAGMEKQSRESFHWVCTYPGEVRDPNYIYLTQDRNPPSMFDEFPGACDLVKEPEVPRPAQQAATSETPPAADGSEGPGQSADVRHDPITRSGRGGGVTTPFSLSGTYRVDIENKHCKSVRFTLSDPDGTAVYSVPQQGAKYIVGLPDGDYRWDVRATAKNDKQKCRWTVTLTS